MKYKNYGFTVCEIKNQWAVYRDKQPYFMLMLKTREEAEAKAKQALDFYERKVKKDLKNS